MKKADLISGDFEDNTMTFKIEGDMILKAGKYTIYTDEENKNLSLSGVGNCPDLTSVWNEPVLAKIEHINDLGKSKWYEVVYYDGNWRSYSGSKTFEDGEKVVKWKYIRIDF